MPDNYDALLTALQQIEDEAKRLRSILASDTSDPNRRDEASIRATRLWWHVLGVWAPPVASPPTPGSGGGSSGGVNTTYPKCRQSITLT
jgi:hypothetical protein